MLKFLKNSNGKEIEIRSKKSQEKYADQCMTFSTTIVIFGFTGMFILLENTLKFEPFQVKGYVKFVSSILIFVFSLLLSQWSREEAYEIYDRITQEKL